MGKTGSRPSVRSFGQFVDTHQVEVLRYLRRLTGNASDAEDLFQETFLRALPRFDHLRPASNHRAWIYRIATNAFLNYRRTARRRAEVGLDHTDSRRAAIVAAHPDATVTKSAYRREVSRLPPRQRAAFIQRVVMGLSYREIAAAMGGTQGAARANVSEAVRRLRRVLINLE